MDEKPASPRQVIQVAEHQIPLPDGVTAADWGLEKVRWQNPRIRAFLGCIRLLGGVLESNYAILHCSPERLLEIWRKVRTVADLMRTKVLPLLSAPSVIPALDRTRESARMALEMLSKDVLASLDRFPEQVPPDRLMEVRKLLCVSIGQIHAYLQDTFGELMASDPRSLHDADYFLSRRFPQDIEEAEWLHLTVDRLREYLAELEPRRERHLAGLLADMSARRKLPEPEAWEAAVDLFRELRQDLTPKLQETLALRGIRFYEMEILDRYAVDIPTKSRMIVELHDAGVDVIEAIGGGQDGDELSQSVRDLAYCHGVFSRRIVDLAEEIDRDLRDLVAFVPLWLQGIERRRALLLRRSGDPRLEEDDLDEYDLDEFGRQPTPAAVSVEPVVGAGPEDDDDDPRRTREVPHLDPR